VGGTDGRAEGFGLLSAILAWADGRDDIRAVVQTGSWARPEGPTDAWSDLDLELFTTEPAAYASCDWPSEIAPIWVCLPLARDDDGRYRMRLAVFEGGQKVDFAVAPIEVLRDQVRDATLTPLYARGYRILIDRDGLAERLPTPTHRPPPGPLPTEPEFRAAVEEFWFEASEIPKYLMRNELWVVKFRDWTMKSLLLRLLEWHATATGKHGDVWQIGRRMSEWLSPDVYGRLGSIFGHFDRADSWRALLATCSVFRDVARESAAGLGFHYPEAMDSAIAGYVHSLGDRLQPGDSAATAAAPNA
jgi:aminoglycoside 6-adenylyltransferase